MTTDEKYAFEVSSQRIQNILNECYNRSGQKKEIDKQVFKYFYFIFEKKEKLLQFPQGETVEAHKKNKK